MDLHLEIFSDRRWSYANAGSRRPLIKEIHLHCAGSLPDHDIKIVPRVTFDFPLPDAVAELRQGNVWYWPDVESWLVETGRR